MIYETLLAKANEEVKKVVDFIKANDDMFDTHDLKLHDVSYYCYKDMEDEFPLCYAETDYGYFEIFCNCEYDEFMDWCAEHNINFDKIIDRVGRTSQFYLHKWHDRDIDYMLYNIVNDIDCWYRCDYINFTDGVITSTDIETYEEETMETLLYFVEDFYDDFMKAIEDMVEVYEYIKGFKENQVEYFKDFLYGYEEQLAYEEEMKAKAEKERISVINLIQRKYDISDIDMELLMLNA